MVWLSTTVLAGCVAGAPYGCEPAPAREDDSYVSPVNAPDCRPNNDGVIERQEMPFVLGAVARIRVGSGPMDVDVDGYVDETGIRRWDFSTPLPDSQPLARLELQTLENQWFAPSFPQADYAGPLTPGGRLLGPLRIDDAGVHLLGSASAEQDPAEGRTLLVYDVPVTLYPYPLREDAHVTTTARASNAVLLGLTTALSDIYDVRVTGRGTLVLPDMILENTLRVTVRLRRTLVAGDAQQVTHVWVHECLGEVARVISPMGRLADTIPDSFTSAHEVWRLSL
ncbi:MAG: hypothetical protein HY904_13250 [Deltaproteobacteria bacterium]|nr:hypothetical protein [Deltaproteobacteria bacterium]